MTSNLAFRLISAGVGIPVLLFAAVAGGIWLIIVVCLLQVMLLREWRQLANINGVKTNLVAALISTAGLNAWLFLPDATWGIAVALNGLFLGLLLIVFSSARRPVAEGGLTLMAVIYTSLPIAIWVPLRDFSSAAQYGILGPVGVLFAATWLCDSGAYFTGRGLGRHKLFPSASPNKTVEGAIGGLIFCALLLPLMASLQLAEPNRADYIMLPLIVGVLGQLGDLLESLMKREMQVKDSSQLIPGHGGFLDRFDSLLISSPLFFAYLSLFRA